MIKFTKYTFLALVFIYTYAAFIFLELYRWYQRKYTIRHATVLPFYAPIPFTRYSVAVWNDRGSSPFRYFSTIRFTIRHPENDWVATILKGSNDDKKRFSKSFELNAKETVATFAFLVPVAYLGLTLLPTWILLPVFVAVSALVISDAPFVTGKTNFYE